MFTVGLGFILGFLIGLTGVGGGALVAPALYVLLGLGYEEAVAVSLVYALATKVVSALQHLRQGTVLWKIALLYGLTGIPGAVIGSHLMYTMSGVSEFLPYFMSGVLFVVSTFLVIEATGVVSAEREKPFSATDFTVKSVAVVIAIQFAVGLLLGITSVGAGSLVIVSMLYLFRMRVKEIVGSNIVIALIMVIPAGMTHYFSGGLDWSLLSLLLLGSLVGAVLGSKATMIASDRLLKNAIAILVALAAVSIIIKASSGSG